MFIDEAESILTSRSLRRGNAANVDVNLVQMFLAEMDGLEDSGAFFILATNRPQDLDPAVVREGRIDRRVHVGRPTKEGAEAILRHHMKGRPIAGPPHVAANAVAELLWQPRHVLWILRCRDGKDVRLTLGDVVSGAMLAGLVEAATEKAIGRALATGDAKGKIEAEDWQAAVLQSAKEHRAMGHNDELTALVQKHRGNVIGYDQPTDGAAP